MVSEVLSSPWSQDMDLVRGTRQDLDLVWMTLGGNLATRKMRMPFEPKMSKTDAAVHESTSIHSPVWDTKF